MSIIKEKFTVPSYYKHFRCKGAACRHTCCVGLSVNISQAEYFRLVGLSCSGALRADLDVALKPLKEADPYRYAAITPDFFGNCRMLDANGLCRLQSECGGDALPITCRYFPRSPRFTGGCQCAMANACEETLELLYEMPQWQTEEMELTFVLDGPVTVNKNKKAVQQWIDHQQQVEKALRYLASLFPYQTGGIGGSGKDQSSFYSNISEGTGKPDPASPDASKCQDSSVRKHMPEPISWKQISSWTGAHWGQITRLLHWAGDTYDSVRPYCEAADGLLVREFDGARLEHDLSALRQHDSAFDHFLVMALTNDLFYHFYPIDAPAPSSVEQGTAVGHNVPALPSSSPGKSAQENGRTVLQYTTAMLLVLCTANLNETSTKEELIDLFAGFFRMVDLTPFAHNCLLISSETLL